MTMRHNPSHTAQPERKLNRSCNGRRKCVTEGDGYGKIKLHHLHYHSELLLQQTAYPYKFHTLLGASVNYQLSVTDLQTLVSFHRNVLSLKT